MWKSLSDDEVREIRDRYIGYSWTEGFWQFVNDVDTKLKEKNYDLLMQQHQTRNSSTHKDDSMARV